MTNGRPRRDIDQTLLRQWLDAGLSIREIARRFDCTPSTIRARVRELGLVHGRGTTHG